MSKRAYMLYYQNVSRVVSGKKYLKDLCSNTDQRYVLMPQCLPHNYFPALVVWGYIFFSGLLAFLWFISISPVLLQLQKCRLAAITKRHVALTCYFINAFKNTFTNVFVWNWEEDRQSRGGWGGEGHLPNGHRCLEGLKKALWKEHWMGPWIVWIAGILQ